MKRFMKRFIVLAVLVFLLPVLAHAADFRMATGKPDRNYDTFGRKFLSQQVGGKINMLYTNTQGTKDNVELLQKGAVDGSMIQGEALFLYPNLEVEVVAQTHSEYVFLIVRKDGPSTIKDFKKSDKLAVDLPDSGTQLTWDAFCKSDTSYKEIPTVPLGGPIALGKLRSGDITGVLIVGGLKSPDVARAASTGEFKLAAVDDWDFNNTKYKGKPIYEFDKITSKAYPELFPGAMNFSVETIRLPAYFVISSKYAMENSSEFDRLYDGANKAVPSMRTFLEGK